MHSSGMAPTHPRPSTFTARSGRASFGRLVHSTPLRSRRVARRASSRTEPGSNRPQPVDKGGRGRLGPRLSDGRAFGYPWSSSLEKTRDGEHPDTNPWGQEAHGPGIRRSSNADGAIPVCSPCMQASAASTLNLRVQPLQFCSGVVDLELPVYAALFGVGLVGPDPDLRL